MTTGSSQKPPEYLSVTYTKPRPYHWSSGKYLGKLYKEAKENKKLVTNRCPKCKQLMWPPIAFCGRCKVETGEDWVVMSDKGTVIQYTYLVYPLWDPHYGEKIAEQYPMATIHLDNGVYLIRHLEEKDTKKLRVGMRVQIVWHDDAQRGRGLNDIKYFRTIEE